MGKNLLLWLIIAAVLLTVFQNFNVDRGPEEVSYSELLDLISTNQVEKADITAPRSAIGGMLGVT